MRLARESGVNNFLDKKDCQATNAALSYDILAYFEDSVHIINGGQGKMCQFVSKLFSGQEEIWVCYQLS